MSTTSAHSLLGGLPTSRTTLTALPDIPRTPAEGSTVRRDVRHTAMEVHCIDFLNGAQQLLRYCFHNWKISVELISVPRGPCSQREQHAPNQQVAVNAPKRVCFLKATLVNWLWSAGLGSFFIAEAMLLWTHRIKLLNGDEVLLYRAPSFLSRKRTQFGSVLSDQKTLIRSEEHTSELQSR